MNTECSKYFIRTRLRSILYAIQSISLATHSHAFRESSAVFAEELSREVWQLM